MPTNDTTPQPVTPARPNGRASGVTYVIAIRSERDEALAKARTCEAETRRLRLENAQLTLQNTTLRDMLKRRSRRLTRHEAGARP